MGIVLVQSVANFNATVLKFYQEWRRVRDILAPEGPDEDALKQEKLKQVSLELQRGWPDNKKVIWGSSC